MQDDGSSEVTNNSIALSQQGSFAMRNTSFALDIGAVSTEQLAIKYPLGTAALVADVERTSKYIKSWSKRSMTFDEAGRSLTYSRSREEPPKGTLVVNRVVRLAEQYDVGAHDPSLFAVEVYGTLPDGKEESWRFRLLSEAEFFVWYNIIRRSVAAAGLMEPIDYGLPDMDPRNNTRFAGVPLEHLRKFILLERAILYYFGLCTMYTGPSLDSVQRNIIAVGDRCVYVFRNSSDVVRCIPFSVITGLMCPADDAGACHFIVVKCDPEEHDLVIEHINEGSRVCEIISAVQNTHSTAKHPTTIDVQHTCRGTVADFVKANDIKLLQGPNYEMKPISPTPKSKLKAALDLYTQEHGTAYFKSSSKRKMSRKSSSKLSRSRSTIEPSPEGTPSAGNATLSVASKVANAITSSDPLLRLLGYQGLPQYIDLLVSQHIDVSLLSCMDPVDLANFGVSNMNHATLIVEAAKEKEDTGTTPRPSHPPSQMASPTPTPTMVPSYAAAPPVVDIDDDLEVGSPTVSKPPILLDDDSDDELLPSSAKTGGSVAPPLMTGGVNLSDSDDLDITMPPTPATAPQPTIDLDDDDI